MSAKPPAPEMPSVASIEAAAAVATTAESASYFAQAIQSIVNRIIKALKMSSEAAAPLHNLTNVIQKSAERVDKAQPNTSRWWSGLRPLAPLVQTASVELAEANQAWEAKHGQNEIVVDFGFGVTDESSFVRSYSKDNVLHDAETIEQMDKYFKAWLATQGMVCEPEEEGSNKVFILKKDTASNGPLVRVDPIEIRKKILSDFAGYVKEQKSSIQINSKDRSEELRPQAQAETTGAGG